ncbi:uncharacterized protein YbbC (DUF1343 family) [Virgibacillus natechei]|uniref:Uncharacterized protein YbbC (DUF1343 family) n=1 Tax=Virgibacillus natechei TaxID=1216297 RepID=A0ABS4IKR4_9BACI|nr:DUF1343 domain-containing protein [Virgibacillus natechei]MBP1971545.1 uncharacterized protein YbbC (DUF1343 family) [Virgibacillus natechei]UZD11985.1 DUF1343 domain-containing protein [Virgibacillus natechei]
MKLGNENLFTDAYDSLWKDSRIGMVTNYTGINLNFERTIDRLIERGANIEKLFAPEHGFYGVGKAGELIANEVDRKTGIDIISLYDKEKNMDPCLLNNIDVLIMEFQDVGVRFYTYISTMFRVMKTASQVGVPLVILDRPNPLGGTIIEGGGIEGNYHSFVGDYDLPIRHGMTIGELASLYKFENGLDVDLDIVKVEGWKRDWLFSDTDLSWVPPSQNIPDFESCLLYPGTAFIEGTNLSEGRGTAMPFRWIGAPWINGEKLSNVLNEIGLPGVRFRPVMFKPSLSKHQDVTVEGVEIHLTNQRSIVPTEIGLHIIDQTRKLYPTKFSWVKTGNDYFIDLLWGNSTYRYDIELGRPVSEISQEWQDYATWFMKRRQAHLLYT